MFKKRILSYDALIVFFVMAVFFYYIMNYVVSDLPAHADIAIGMLNNHTLFTNNFLLYLLANLFSGFSGDITAVRLSLVLLISVAEAAKYLITKSVFQKYTSINKSVLCSICLLVVYIIPWLSFDINSLYLSYLVPNLWHNSTIIFSIPFAIGMYLFSVELFDSFQNSTIVKLSVCTILCVLVKPSFFLVWICVYPFFILYRYGWTKSLLICMTPAVLGCVCLGYEYLSIFDNSSQDGVYFGLRIPIKLVPFSIKMITSLSFPVVFAFVYNKFILKDKEFWFNVCLLFAAVVIWLFLHESGPRASDGNFYWQIVPCMWLFFAYILKVFINKENYPNTSWKRYTMLSLFGIHVVFGLIYIAKIIISQNPW